MANRWRSVRIEIPCPLCGQTIYSGYCLENHLTSKHSILYPRERSLIVSSLRERVDKQSKTNIVYCK
jgi:hypothetical protein